MIQMRRRAALFITIEWLLFITIHHCAFCGLRLSSSSPFFFFFFFLSSFFFLLSSPFFWRRLCFWKALPSRSQPYDRRGAHGSFSSGNLATETLTFNSTSGPPVEMPKVIFGCGHNNNARPTSDLKRTGIIGLGPGNSSLISQMGTSIAGKFSYCLADQGSSKINFGGIVAGAGVVSTPLIIRDQYFLTLEAISVGDQRLEFVSSSTVGGKIFVDIGNIFVDTGVARTLLPLEYHSKLKLVMSNMIRAQPIEIEIGEPGLSDVLCYNISSQPELPEVTIHFRGADVKLSPANLFQNISDDVMCSAFRGGDANTVYGNIMQINFVIGYDIEQRTVSFKPTHCANN